MNLYEIVGRMEINRQKVEAIKKEIDCLFKRVSFVMKEPFEATMKTVEFLRTETERLEGLSNKKTILEGEIGSLKEQYKLLPKEEG